VIPFFDPVTKTELATQEEALVDSTGRVIAPIVDGIPRFVDTSEDYAENFGWQWQHWHDAMSDSRATGSAKRELLDKRTQFSRFDLEGKSVLECGMGGGDDTEVLLQMPFGEVHSFDLSNAVDRAGKYLEDPRLTLSQASLFEIPYADEAFDVVFCHRVLQHTPDPEKGIRCIAKKVKPGGILFAHCYKKDWRSLSTYKYKYRWFTKRVPSSWVFWFVEKYGARLSDLQDWAHSKNRYVQILANNFIPFDYHPVFANANKEQLLEISKLCTFDALTPKYDKPMTPKHFRRVIEEEGFEIQHMYGEDPRRSPLYMTAVKKG